MAGEIFPSTASTNLVGELERIVSPRHVLSGQSARPHLTGYREGAGEALAVVRPGSLIELWRVFAACIAADHIVVPQAANTGLTGGSTPFGTYDRPLVVLNTMRISGVQVIRGGNQVVCLAGATLDRLERTLAGSGRDPHSVIGSSCLGASVVGGVCNNSGGALVSRGPAFTRLALFATADADGRPRLHNNLGIRLGDEPEEILGRLERGAFTETDIEADDVQASARDYPEIVRDCHANTPARYNNDASRLFETSGSAGKLLVFAVRLDTFATEPATATFYIGSNSSSELTTIRRRLLTECGALPVSAEYIHREAFDLAEIFGKDTVLAIRWLGTRRLPLLFGLKTMIDNAARRVGLGDLHVSDRMLQGLAHLMPRHLPRRLKQFRDRFVHHLVLKVTAVEQERVEEILTTSLSDGGAMFECSPKEAEIAFLHRFAVAGAAVRYRALYPARIESILALDVALRRNDEDWAEELPSDIQGQLAGRIYYGHFLCHVFHRDYLVAKGRDVVALKRQLLARLDARGAEYPAEHNVGHVYRAKADLEAHYRALDPTNSLNPGLGQTSRNKNWM